MFQPSSLLTAAAVATMVDEEEPSPAPVGSSEVMATLTLRCLRPLAVHLPDEPLDRQRVGAAGPGDGRLDDQAVGPRALDPLLSDCRGECEGAVDDKVLAGDYDLAGRLGYGLQDRSPEADRGIPRRPHRCLRSCPRCSCIRAVHRAPGPGGGLPPSPWRWRRSRRR